MNTHINIGDFSSLQVDFEEVSAEINNCVGTVFAKDKFQTLPPWVLKEIVTLEDCVNEVKPE